MTSKTFQPSQEAYVWIWLPNDIDPIVAGKLELQGEIITFIYGQSYLNRKDAISLFEKELPLIPGIILPKTGLSIAGTIRDAAPDAWGRKVLLNRLFGKKMNGSEIKDPFNEIDYLLASGSDRIGALDFQISAKEYMPRSRQNASLEELLNSAERLENGIFLTPELDSALYHGSSIGGARPKALIDDKNKKYIAKFSSSSDEYSVVKSEYIAMRLAAVAGINVAPVSLKRASGKDVLLIERFDRVKTDNGYQRRSFVSALTLFSLNEMMARYASYQDFCEIIRTEFVTPKNNLRELFKRLLFNILISNNDDHARNHAAIWDGKNLSLSPAYDLCPQLRRSRESNQAMLIQADNKTSQLETCFRASNQFLLTRKEAIKIAEEMMISINKHWSSLIMEGKVTEVDERIMKTTQFMHPYAFEELADDASQLLLLKSDFHKQLF